MTTVSLANLQQQAQKPDDKKKDLPPVVRLLEADGPKLNLAMTKLLGKKEDADRFIRIALNACQTVPNLAYCNPKTVVAALLTLSGIRLEPNTPRRHACLIPREKSVKIDGQWVKELQCNVMIEYRGYRELAFRSPLVLSLDAEAIHENDVYECLYGSDSFLKFKKTLKERGALVGGFAYAKLSRGGEAKIELPLEDIFKIRERSDTYNFLFNDLMAQKEGSKEWIKAKKKFDETPWVLWEDQMVAKSATRRLCPLLPSDDGAMALAVQVDEKTIDIESMTDPDHIKAMINGDAPIVTQGVGDFEEERTSLDIPALEHDEFKPEIIIPVMKANTPELAPHNWEPSAEEQQAIHDREMLESQGQQQMFDKPATKPQPAQRAGSARRFNAE